MKKKIMGIFVCMLMMFIAFSPSLSGENRIEQNSCLYTFTNPLIVSMFENVSESQFIDFVRELTLLGPRVTGNTACDTAAENIYDHFTQAGLQVRYQNWSLANFSGRNVEATLQGFDQSSTEIYIVCGHYDSVEGSPGADDNAGGTAAVLIAADVLSHYAFNHTIRFVAFSGEEQILLGSSCYVEEAHERNENIAGVLNLDMIGHAETEQDENGLMIYDRGISKWLTNFTVSISTEYTSYINLPFMYRSIAIKTSDHWYFLEAGYPAIYYFEARQNLDAHSDQDLLKNMNTRYATKVIKLVIATLATLAESIMGAPLKPGQPSGDKKGNVGQEYSYTTSTTDPDGDQVYYFWDWGDGNNSGWLGPYSSGAIISMTHTWTIKDSYSIKVKAKDINGKESQWSDPLPITMPYSYNPMLQFLEWLLERFPTAFPLLRQLMGY